MNAHSLTKKLYYLEKKSNIFSSVCMISIMTACVALSSDLQPV